MKKVEVTQKIELGDLTALEEINKKIENLSSLGNISNQNRNNLFSAFSKLNPFLSNNVNASSNNSLLIHTIQQQSNQPQSQIQQPQSNQIIQPLKAEEKKELPKKEIKENLRKNSLLKIGRKTVYV